MSGAHELESRYARLLGLYPAGYRRARGAEMLAVLMEGAAPDQRRPALREQWALLIGALRVRTGANGHRTAGETWRVALRAAVLVLLLLSPHELGVVAFAPVAIVAVLRQHYLVGALATAGVVVTGSGGSSAVLFGHTVAWSWEPVLALVLLVPLIGRGPITLPRSLRYVVGLSLLPFVAGLLGTLTGEPAFYIAGQLLWQVFAVLALLWAVVDERVALTVGVILLAGLIEAAWVAWPVAGFTLWSPGVLLAVPLILIAAGAVAVRRRARL